MSSAKKTSVSVEPDAELHAAAEKVAQRLQEANAAGEPFPEHWGSALEKLIAAPKRSARWSTQDAARAAIAYDGLLPLARDARTPPDLLRRMDTALQEGTSTVSDSGLPAIRLASALAGNPNTPPQQLARRAGDDPRAFCRNPAVPLAVLEDPAFVRWIPAPAAARLLRRSDIPPPLLAAYAAGNAGHPRPDNPDPAEEARMHVGLAGELVPGEWEEKVRAFWRHYAANLPDWNERETLRELAALYLTPPIGESIAEQGNGEGSQTYTERLLKTCDPATPPEELAEIAKALQENEGGGYCAALRIALVLNPSTPEEAQEGLRHRWGRDALLTPVATPEEALIICRDLVRRQVRSEPSDRMPLVTYVILVGFGEPRRRPPSRYSGTLTARHRSAARSDDWRMRLTAALTLPAQNPKSVTHLAQLATDGNQLVRAAAKARLADPTAGVFVL